MYTPYISSMLKAKATQETRLILSHDPNINYYPYFVEEAKKLNPDDPELQWLDFKVLHHAGKSEEALLLLRGIMGESSTRSASSSTKAADKPALIKRLRAYLKSSKQQKREYLDEYLEIQEGTAD
jgi:hypothetical protein